MALVEVHRKGQESLWAQVDDEDYDFVNQYRYRPDVGSSGVVYARTLTPRPPGDDRPGKRSIAMHNLILGIVGVDHINHDGLDNRRQNLRPANHSQQNMNARRVGATSMSHGVSVHPHSSRYRARIQVAGRSISLGTYDTEEEASAAYKRAALLHFGEFALADA